MDNYFITKFGFVFHTVRTSNTNKLIGKVYRVRKFNKSINGNLIAEFSHPPASLTKNIQRANLPYHPVFYGAPSAHTALLETLSQTFEADGKNLYFLSEWEFRKDQPIYVTPFIYGEYDKVDAYNQMAAKGVAQFKKEIPDLTEDESASIDAVFKMFSSLFEYEHTHAISGYLGHRHLYFPGNVRSDLLIYPSIQTDKRTLNYAFHPNAVIHKLMLKRIFLFGINKYDLNKETGKAEVSFAIQDRLGINNDHGYLIWRNLPEEDEQDFKELFPAK